MRTSPLLSAVMGVMAGLSLTCSDETIIAPTETSTTSSPIQPTNSSGSSSSPIASTTGGSTHAADEAGSTTDGGVQTTGRPTPGLGALAGECSVITPSLLAANSPSLFENAIDFRGVGFEYERLTPQGQEILDAGNLGGSSLHSEVIAFEVLARCEDAELLATETGIRYIDPMGTKTDLRVEIDGHAIGVSVTRAIGFPPRAPYTPRQATMLLERKLEDVLASTANVSPLHGWSKQILHVIAYADSHAQSLREAYASLPPQTRADTVLIITVTHGNDAFLY